MADIFDVIADGTRRDILQLLRDRRAADDEGTSVSQIVAELSVSQPTVSKHLRVLRDAELVSVREEGQHRFYSLQSEPLGAVEDWLVQFVLDDDDDVVALGAVSLPEPAAHAADVVGRAAASAKHVVTSVLGKIPGR